MQKGQKGRNGAYHAPFSGAVFVDVVLGERVNMTKVIPQRKQTSKKTNSLLIGLDRACRMCPYDKNELHITQSRESRLP